MDLSDELDYMDLDCYGKRMVRDMIWHAVMIGLVLKDLSRYCKRLVLDLVWQRPMDMASDFMRRERKGESDFGFALSCTSGHLKNDDLGLWRLDTGRKTNRIGLRRLLIRD
jgi:hypothetical protein